MSLDLAPKSKGHVRSIMHILFNWAMKWEFIDIDRMNPMSLVRVEGSSKRLKEFRVLLDELQEPTRTMCIVAACLGLRASELVGLQWGDFDWKALEVHIQRGVVVGRVDEVKTTNSNRRLPVHPNLADLLFAYKEETAPGAGNCDCSQVPTGPGVHDGRGWFSAITCFPPESAPELVLLAGTVSGIRTPHCFVRYKWT